MKWQQDLVCDIRTNSPYDDVDTPPLWFAPFELSDCNIAALTEKFMSVRDRCQSILEIGVDNNNERSITRIFHEHKLNSTIYVGIDIKEKSYLNDTTRNIFTIQNDSKNYVENMEKIKQLGVKQFDFIFIDGWHSINQVLAEWEYTNFLSEWGIVALHDTRGHPGPSYFIKALDTSKWNVEANVCNIGADYGIGFAQKILPTTAINLVGVSKGQSIGWRQVDHDWRMSCENIKDNLINIFPKPSVYITTYNNSSVSELIEFYKPKKSLILPWDGSHQRTTCLESLELLKTTREDFIIITRFDIQFNLKMNVFKFDKFNCLCRDIEQLWNQGKFVNDVLFAFPKKYLDQFIDAVKTEHLYPFRDKPDLHRVYHHMVERISEKNCHIIFEGCFDALNNPYYSITR